MIRQRVCKKKSPRSFSERWMDCFHLNRKIVRRIVSEEDLEVHLNMLSLFCPLDRQLNM